MGRTGGDIGKQEVRKRGLGAIAYLKSLALLSPRRKRCEGSPVSLPSTLVGVWHGFAHRGDAEVLSPSLSQRCIVSQQPKRVKLPGKTWRAFCSPCFQLGTRTNTLCVLCEMPISH